MSNRRDFIKKTAAAGLIGTMPGVLISHKGFAKAQSQPSNDMIWADLLHLSYNMWEDHIPDGYADEDFERKTCMDARLWAHGYRPDL